MWGGGGVGCVGDVGGRRARGHGPLAAPPGYATAYSCRCFTLIVAVPLISFKVVLSPGLINIWKVSAMQSRQPCALSLAIGLNARRKPNV